MRAKDVMTHPVATVGPDDDVQNIAETLMNRCISAVPVVNENEVLLGIVSEGDLMRHTDAGTQVPAFRSWWLRLMVDPANQARSYVKQHGRLARDVMTKNVVTIDEDATLPQIAAILEKNGIKRVPVVADGKVRGIVSRANLLYGLAAQQAPSEQSHSDSELSATIDAAIKEAGIRTTYFNVVVSNGVARLWGIVESKQESDALDVITSNVSGLKSTENNVRVMAMPGGYS